MPLEMALSGLNSGEIAQLLWGNLSHLLTKSDSRQLCAANIRLSLLVILSLSPKQSPQADQGNPS